MGDEGEDRQAEALRAAFSRHGYGFQYAVVKECVRLHNEGFSKWSFNATELPVEVHGTPLHIDILLGSSLGLLVLECKRANPSISTWCFGRSEYSSRRSSEMQFVRLDAIVNLDPEGFNPVAYRGAQAEQTTDQYHVALEIKTGHTGDAQGVGRGALDDAVTQALRGCSGLINAIVERPHDMLVGRRVSTRIVPAVITTARLLTCETDLSESALDTGELPPGIAVTEKPWLWYRSNPSAHLRHSAPTFEETQAQTPLRTFGAVADAISARSVAIVSWSGLQKFLRAASFHVGDY